MRISFFLLFLMIIPFGLNAQEDSIPPILIKEVVLNITRFPHAKEESGKLITKRENLETVVGQSLSDVLNEFSGLEINGSQGVFGTNLGIFSRGGRTNSTSILLDGVPIVDESTIEQSVDLNLIDVGFLQSVEYIRGGLSSLYGSGASTGVIQLNTKKTGTNTGSAHASFGSYKTYKGRAHYSAQLSGDNSLNYNVGLGFLNTEAFSTAKQEDQALPEYDKDGGERINGFFGFDYQPEGKFSVSQKIMYNHILYRFDGGAFTDAEKRGINEQIIWIITPSWTFNSGSIYLKTSYQTHDRTFQTRSISQYENDHQFKSFRYTADLSSHFTINSNAEVIAGMFGSHQKFNSRSVDFNTSIYGLQLSADSIHNTIIEPYISTVAKWNNLRLHGGVRTSIHSTFGNHWTTTINPSYSFELSSDEFFTLKGSYSTAFISPSLFQIFSDFGNRNLQPEKSSSFEAGFTWLKKNKLELSSVFFYRKEKNLIDFSNEVFQYENIDRSDAKGVDAQLSYSFLKEFQLSGFYSYIYREEDRQLRIPRNKFGVSLEKKQSKYNSIKLSYQYTSPRSDSFFNSSTLGNETVRLSPYKLVDFYLNQELIKNRLIFQFSARNLLNEDYEEIVGFNTKGINFTLDLYWNIQ